MELVFDGASRAPHPNAHHKTAPRGGGVQQAGGGLHMIGKGSVRAAIASEGYVLHVEVRLHNVHVHDQVFITKNDEHVEEHFNEAMIHHMLWRLWKIRIK